jgi:hypothetical protein
MGIFSFFKSKGTVAGEVVLRGLPEHEMLDVSVGFFVVAAAASAPLSDDTTPAGAWKDVVSIKENSEPKDKPLRFYVERPAGFYYLAISAIVYMRRDGKMFAQVERFFPMTQPCEIKAGPVPEIRLEARWPDIPLEELGSYGVFRPGQPPELF